MRDPPFFFFWLHLAAGRTSLTRDGTHVPIVEAQGFNHWTTGEFQEGSLLNQLDRILLKADQDDQISRIQGFLLKLT